MSTKPLLTLDKTAPVTVMGTVFAGTGAGNQKNTQGLPVSPLTNMRSYVGIGLNVKASNHIGQAEKSLID